MSWIKFKSNFCNVIFVSFSAINHKIIFFTRLFDVIPKVCKRCWLYWGSSGTYKPGTFFLLPIITKSLGTYYYGLWAQINITVSLISSFALMGLSMGLVRFLSSETDKKIIREAVYSIFFFVTMTGLLASSLLYIFAEPLATFGFRDPEATYFIKAGSLLILLNVIEPVSLLFQSLQADQEILLLYLF